MGRVSLASQIRKILNPKKLYHRLNHLGQRWFPFTPNTSLEPKDFLITPKTSSTVRWLSEDNRLEDEIKASNYTQHPTDNLKANIPCSHLHAIIGGPTSQHPYFMEDICCGACTTNLKLCVHTNMRYPGSKRLLVDKNSYDNRRKKPKHFHRSLNTSNKWTINSSW